VPLSASSNSNPYAVSFLDVHDNVDHHAITLGGFSNNGGPEAAFSVAVVSTSPTQYFLTVSLFGSTSFSQLQFQLLLIGTEATGIVEARSFSSCGLTQTLLSTFTPRATSTWLVHQ
jgi:hypothetical protein